jgi:hypothetical protein
MHFIKNLVKLAYEHLETQKIFPPAAGFRPSGFIPPHQKFLDPRLET